MEGNNNIKNSSNVSSGVQFWGFLKRNVPKLFALWAKLTAIGKFPNAGAYFINKAQERSFLQRYGKSVPMLTEGDDRFSENFNQELRNVDERYPVIIKNQGASGETTAINPATGKSITYSDLFSSPGGAINAIKLNLDSIQPNSKDFIQPYIIVHEGQHASNRQYLTELALLNSFSAALDTDNFKDFNKFVSNIMSYYANSEICKKSLAMDEAHFNAADFSKLAQRYLDDYAKNPNSKQDERAIDYFQRILSDVQEVDAYIRTSLIKNINKIPEAAKTLKEIEAMQNNFVKKFLPNSKAIESSIEKNLKTFKNRNIIKGHNAEL